MTFALGFKFFFEFFELYFRTCPVVFLISISKSLQISFFCSFVHTISTELRVWRHFSLLVERFLCSFAWKSRCFFPEDAARAKPVDRFRASECVNCEKYCAKLTPDMLQTAQPAEWHGQATGFPLDILWLCNYLRLIFWGEGRKAATNSKKFF